MKPRNPLPWSQFGGTCFPTDRSRKPGDLARIFWILLHDEKGSQPENPKFRLSRTFSIARKLSNLWRLERKFSAITKLAIYEQNLASICIPRQHAPKSRPSHTSFSAYAISQP